MSASYTKKKIGPLRWEVILFLGVNFVLWGLMPLLPEVLYTSSATDWFLPMRFLYSRLELWCGPDTEVCYIYLVLPYLYFFLALIAAWLSAQLPLYRRRIKEKTMATFLPCGVSVGVGVVYSLAALWFLLFGPQNNVKLAIPFSYRAWVEPVLTPFLSGFLAGMVFMFVHIAFQFAKRLLSKKSKNKTEAH